MGQKFLFLSKRPAGQNRHQPTLLMVERRLKMTEASVP